MIRSHKKRFLATVMTLAMLLSLLPAVTLPVAAAEVTVDNGLKNIFLNGNPVIIDAGTSGTLIYIDADADGIIDEGESPADLSGPSGDSMSGYDLSTYNIYGSAASGSVSSSTITMLGGQVSYIFGSGPADGTDVTGDTHIAFHGGTAFMLYGGGNYGNVGGSTNVNVTGGTVSGGIVGGCGSGTVSGSSNVTITGGTIGGNVYGGGWVASVLGSATVIIGVDANITGTVSSGCAGGGTVGTGSKVLYEVAFYDESGGAKYAFESQYPPQWIEAGGTAAKPAADPEQDGMIFSAWKKVSDDSDYNFSSAVTVAVKLYPGWTDGASVSLGGVSWTGGGSSYTCGLALSSSCKMVTISVDSGYFNIPSLGSGSLTFLGGTNGTTYIDSYTGSSQQFGSAVFSFTDVSQAETLLGNIVFSPVGTAAQSIKASASTVSPLSGDLYFEGHFYRYVAGSMNWLNALLAAGSITDPYFGGRGYLATATSQAENSILLKLVDNHLGGSDHWNDAWMGGLWQRNQGSLESPDIVRGTDGNELSYSVLAAAGSAQRIELLQDYSIRYSGDAVCSGAGDGSYIYQHPETVLYYWIDGPEAGQEIANNATGFSPWHSGEPNSGDFVYVGWQGAYWDDLSAYSNDIPSNGYASLSGYIVEFSGYDGGSAAGIVDEDTLTVALPTVASISPASGFTTGGTNVTITGTNFTGATDVTIGGTAATDIIVVNSTTITAKAPANTAGTKDVVVTTPGGTGTGAGLFTYVANNPPKAGFGKAMVFDGTNYVQFPVDSTQNITTEFTVEMWVKKSATADSAAYLFSRNQNGVSGQWSVVSYDGYILFYINDASYGVDQTEIPITDAEWHHIAYTLKDDVLTFYKDGQLVGIYAKSLTLSTAPQYFYIGGLFNGLNPAHDSVDELRVWNACRTQTQIQDGMYHEMDASVPGYSSLVFCCKCEDGSGSSVTESVTGTAGTVLDQNGYTVDGSWTGSDIRTWTTYEDTSVSGYLVGSDPDGSGGLTYEIVSNGSKGTAAVVSGTNQFTYTPAQDLNGTDTFTYRVRDGYGAYSNTQTVNISIAPVGDPPTVTDANISISGATGTGGVFKIGDTVSATWDNTSETGDNNSGITAVTVDFSQFGGGTAFTATNNAGIWTATFSITAGSIDAMNRNVSVTATRGAEGSATAADTTNAAVDNIPPTITDDHITITGGTGTGGAYRVGDLVTAAWDNTAAGDSNSDTVSGVIVDFSAFGGGFAVAASNSSDIWTASYTVVAGSITGLNKNISVTVTDNAGNTRTAADSANAAVDNIAPLISSVSGPSASTYGIGENLDFTVNFSEAVIVTGNPYITLTVGSNTVHAVYQSGSGTASLRFRYAVTSGDFDSNGIASGSPITLNGGTINDTAGNDASLAFTPPVTTSVLVDGVAPSVTLVSRPAAGTYVAGDNLDFTAVFSENVTVAGSPYITLTVGSNTVHAVYVSGSGTSSLTFRHPVTSGELDSDGIASASPIALNSGSITDEVGNDATLTFTPPTTTSVLVDAVAPSVSFVTGPAAGTYIAGDNLDFTVDFSEAVAVTGSPYITLTVGSNTVHTVYLIGNGTSSLRFRYTLVSGDFDPDGIASGSPIILNGGAITDEAGNDASLAFTPPTTTSVLVSTVPTVETADLSEILSSSAVMGGTVASNGGETVTERGVVYSSSDPTPEVGETGITKDGTGSGTGSFSKTIGCLAPGTVYYVCAYATNSVGTSYGTVKSFVTADTYTIGSLSSLAMTALTQGYASGTQETKTVTLVKTGTGNLTSLAVALSGEDASSFAITQPDETILNSGTSCATFTVKAKNGLTAGTHTATVMVSADHMADVSFTVTQVIYSDDPDDDNGGAPVIVNGETQTAGTLKLTTDSGGQTTATVTVDSAKLEKLLSSEDDGATVVIPITGRSDRAVGLLTGAMIKVMENKDVSLVVETGSATYTLPASELDIDSISQHLGKDLSLADIVVQIKVEKPSGDMVRVTENAAGNGGMSIVVPAVSFTITCEYGGKTAEVSTFHSYVERMVAIPSGVDPTRITTGVVVRPDGTTYHVPTEVMVIDGVYYAKINSLTNSTYMVVWHPVEFADMEFHWAKDSVNDMGSRMVVYGVGGDRYAPDRDITRAEFAAIVIRALGLGPGAGDNSFSDINPQDWYCGYIETALEYGIIAGYGNGRFGPNDKITREQALTMLARAMRLTGIDISLTDSETSRLLGAFTDSSDASAFAEESIAACLKAGITSGTGSSMISPGTNITRAEVAVMIQRLLQKSGLI